MIFSNSLMRRRSDVDIEEFQAHWLDPHGPMTAKLPGTQTYFQNHVMFSQGTNDLARQLRIDGFAQLSYNGLQDRMAAYGSEELKRCDLDSPLFIGGVSRVVTNVDDGQARRNAGNLSKAVILVPRTAGAGPSDDPKLTPAAIMQQLEGIDGYATHEIIEQAGPPGSAVPFLGQEVDLFLEIWFASEADLFKSSEKASTYNPRLAVFDVKVHRFL